MLTISNGISIFRGILVIPTGFALWHNDTTSILMFAVLAYLSDIADGYIARKMNQISEAGKIIDPLADKIFVGVSALILIIQGKLPIWFVGYILFRDIAILLAGIYATKKLGFVLPSNYTGKVAVVFIAFALISVVISAPAHIQMGLMLVASAMMTASLVVYANRLVRELGRKKN